MINITEKLILIVLLILLTFKAIDIKKRHFTEEVVVAIDEDAVSVESSVFTLQDEIIVLNKKIDELSASITEINSNLDPFLAKDERVQQVITCSYKREAEWIQMCTEGITDPICEKGLEAWLNDNVCLIEDAVEPEPSI